MHVGNDGDLLVLVGHVDSTGLEIVVLTWLSYKQSGKKDEGVCRAGRPTERAVLHVRFVLVAGPTCRLLSR